jgi:hypothetical protein
MKEKLLLKFVKNIQTVIDFSEGNCFFRSGRTERCHNDSKLFDECFPTMVVIYANLDRVSVDQSFTITHCHMVNNEANRVSNDARRNEYFLVCMGWKAS